MLGLFLSMWIGVCELIYRPYHEHPPLSAAGCATNPVDMFTDGINKDGVRINDLIKRNESSSLTNPSSIETTASTLDVLKFTSMAEAGARFPPEATESPFAVFGNISVEKIDKFTMEPWATFYGMVEFPNPPPRGSR